ncbi:MAG: aminopeptidase P family protein [Pseudomonadota bacterium]
MFRALLLAPLLVAFTSFTHATVPAGELQRRWNALAKELPDTAILVLLPAQHAVRSRDVDWPYRQDNDVVYYTGATLPDSGLILVKDRGETTSVVVTKTPDPVFAVWEGDIPDAKSVREATGADLVITHSDKDRFLRTLTSGLFWEEERTYRRSMNAPSFPGVYEALKDGELTLWLDLGRFRSTQSAEESQALEFAREVRGSFPEIEVRDASTALIAARSVKSDWELERMREVIDITTDAQIAIMKRAPSVSHEYQLEATLEYVFRDSGACCPSFPSIVAAGRNATILHYGENNDPIDDDALVLVDIGAEKDFYAADVTRTFPRSGVFTEPQREIYEAVLDAQSAVMEQVRPGVFHRELTETAIDVLGKHLLKLGLISENTEEQVKVYFMHGLGHGLGMDVHDDLDYTAPLEQGHVFTIEPGLYIRKDDALANAVFADLDEETIRVLSETLDRYDGIGVRIEDDVAVTRRGYELLSDGAPRTINEIEALMASEGLAE